MLGLFYVPLIGLSPTSPLFPHFLSALVGSEQGESTGLKKSTAETATAETKTAFYLRQRSRKALFGSS